MSSKIFFDDTTSSLNSLFEIKSGLLCVNECDAISKLELEQSLNFIFKFCAISPTTNNVDFIL